jgi:Flp pilus assembly pilin Flp
MNGFRKAIERFARDQRGTETLEWGLICGLIIVGAIAMITLIGPKVQSSGKDFNGSIPKAP